MMRIRPFGEADFPAILEIYARSKLDELVHERGKFVLLPLLEDEKRLREFRESEVHVCEDEGGVVAYGALHGSEIRAMFVHPDRRGKGVGRQLLEFLLSRIEGPAVLYVAKSNTPARNLYRKFGFEVTNEFETTYNEVPVLANKMTRTNLRSVLTNTLEIAYLESGPATGPAAILLHGWPSDVHDFDAVAAQLAESGLRVLVPYLRGFGPTKFLDEATPRSGQQAAIGRDLVDFMDALGLKDALLAGYDWGGRAACVVSALWPERVRGLVSINGYAIQDIAAASRTPADAQQESRYWYQWYFHTSRGREGLVRNRREITKLLWRLWSPNWRFAEAEFEATAKSFDNPDFVDITIQSYCHRYGNARGDPAYDEIEKRLAALPSIAAPSIVLHGECDAVGPPSSSEKGSRHFSGRYERQVIPVAGHFLSRENPEAVARAILSLA